MSVDIAHPYHLPWESSHGNARARNGRP